MIKLLHVDDDVDILELTKLSLEISGDFDVVSCSSGIDAIRAVRNCMPDVLLLDFMMPGMTGPETLEEMRTISGLEAVPAIFMTARLDESRTELLALGAKEVIAKPFDAMTLGAQIKAAMMK